MEKLSKEIKMSVKVIATNRKARFQYHIYDVLEAGIVLQGSEIKSIRAGQMSLAEAYVRIENSEAWLVDAHIAPYEHAGIFNHNPTRPRKLLLHRRQINRLLIEVRQKGLTIVPLRTYLRSGRAKVEIAVARGKKTHDKRRAIAERDAQREADRAIKKR